MLDFINVHKFDKKSLRVGLVSNNREVVTSVYQYIIDNYKVLESRNSKFDSNITFVKDGKDITISHIQPNQSARGQRLDYMMIDKYFDKEGNVIADYTKESGYVQFDGAKLFNIDKELLKREYLCTWVGNEDDLAIKLNDEENVDND